MKIAVLGTGMVGQAHAGKLSELGHDVVVGSRDPKSKIINVVKTVTFAEAAKHGELIIEAPNGQVVIDALKSIKVNC